MTGGYGHRATAGAAPGDYGARIGAALIDVVVSLAGIIVIAVVFSTVSAINETVGALVVVVGGLGLYIWYFVVRQGQTGQTIGKKQMNIMLVADRTAQPPGIGLAAARLIFAYTTNLFTCGLYGFIDAVMVLINQRNKRLTDIMLKLNVVHLAANHQLQPSPALHTPVEAPSEQPHGSLVDSLAHQTERAGQIGEAGDPARALELFQALLPDHQRVLGPDHPDTLHTRHQIAAYTGEAGGPARAVKLFQALLPDHQRVLGPDHPDTLHTRHQIESWEKRASGMSLVASDRTVTCLHCETDLTEGDSFCAECGAPVDTLPAAVTSSLSHGTTTPATAADPSSPTVGRAPAAQTNSRWIPIAGGIVAAIAVAAAASAFVILRSGRHSDAVKTGDQGSAIGDDSESVQSTDTNLASTESTTLSDPDTAATDDLSPAAPLDDVVFESNRSLPFGDPAELVYQAIVSLDELPDGRIVSGNSDGSVQVWDPNNVDAEPILYEGHTDSGFANVLSFSNGKVSSAGSDGVIHVWDPDEVNTVAPVLNFGHSKDVSAMALLANGSIATASFDGTVQIISQNNPDLSSTTFGTILEVVVSGSEGPGHGDFVLSVAALRDGRVMSGGHDKTIRIWEPWNVDAEPIVRQTGSDPEAMIELLNGDIVYVDRGGKLSVWNPADPTGTIAEWNAAPASAYTGERAYSMSLGALPDGRIVSAWTDGVVRIFDPQDLKKPAVEYAGHSGVVIAVEVLLDGRVATASSDGTVRVWRPDQLEAIAGG